MKLVKIKSKKVQNKSNGYIFIGKSNFQNKFMFKNIYEILTLIAPSETEYAENINGVWYWLIKEDIKILDTQKI